MSEQGTVALGAVPALFTPKLLPPLPRTTYVRRERLHECLSRASSTPITLVSAPAGCGKTSLVAAWFKELPAGRRAWLSVDPRDNDPVRFWAHLVEAIRGLAPGVGERAIGELVRSGATALVERWLGVLLDDLSAVDPPTSYLVVDDFHLVTDPEIRASVALFVASMPSWLRLVIMTRADPPFPLPRLRAEGRLNEVRQGDLRFEISEADLLLRAEGIEDLGNDQLQRLMARTEGWAAGLQLAAIVLGDDRNPDRELQIVGSNTTFADYIVSEVVDVVSDDMRTFLFTTAVLDRISPSLAQAVSGLDGAARMLREAQQRGLFLVALDEQGEWFRYHHLFAEAVQAEARSRAPELVRSANERAADWYERHDDVVTALDHWFAADRPDEALRIALVAGYQLIDTGQVKSVERITRLIPASVVGKNADRQIDFAMLSNHIDAQVCLSWLNEAERTIAALAVPDDEMTRRYHAVRAMGHLLFGEWDEAEVHASAAIAPKGVGEGAGAVTQRAGLQLMRAKGWLEQSNDAEQLFHAYVGSPWTPLAVRNLIAPCAWALAAAVGGRIQEAERWCARVAAAGDEVALPQAAHQELLLARVLVSTERGDRDAAGIAADELRAANVTTFHSLRASAEVEVAIGLIADDQLAEAGIVLEDLSQSQPFASLGPRIHDAVDRAWTELHLGAGDIAKARQAAARMRVGFWRDAVHAKVQLVDGESQRAADILRSLSATSPRQHVTLLLLRARSLEDGQQEAGLAMVEAALATAAAEGMLQTVVTSARGLTDMLELASSTAPDQWIDDVRRMLAKGGRGVMTGRVPTLYEQPTDRERVVARYLASRLTVSEIAQELGVSQNTVKTHLKSLYRKLDVTSREDAVATARRLGIIG